MTSIYYGGFDKDKKLRDAVVEIFGENAEKGLKLFIYNGKTYNSAIFTYKKDFLEISFLLPEINEKTSALLERLGITYSDSILAVRVQNQKVEIIERP